MPELTVADATVIQLLEAAVEKITERSGDRSPADREFSLAKTALEDARFRYATGRYKQLGVHKPSDPDTVGDQQRAQTYFAERDAKADAALVDEGHTLVQIGDTTGEGIYRVPVPIADYLAQLHSAAAGFTYSPDGSSYGSKEGKR